MSLNLRPLFQFHYEATESMLLLWRGGGSAPGARRLCCAAVLTQPRPLTLRVKRWQDAAGEQPSAHTAQRSVSAAASTTLDNQRTEVSLSLLRITAACACCWASLIYSGHVFQILFHSHLFLLLFLHWRLNSWLCVIVFWYTSYLSLSHCRLGQT